MAICIAIQWKNTLSRDYGLFTARLVPAENITRIYFIFHIIQTRIVAVGDDSLRLRLEILQSVHHLRSEERTAILQRRFVDDNRSPLRLDALHHTLNGTLAEVVARRKADSDSDRHETHLPSFVHCRVLHIQREKQQDGTAF